MQALTGSQDNRREGWVFICPCGVYGVFVRAVTVFACSISFRGKNSASAFPPQLPLLHICDPAGVCGEKLPQCCLPPRPKVLKNLKGVKLGQKQTCGILRQPRQPLTTFFRALRGIHSCKFVRFVVKYIRSEPCEEPYLLLIVVSCCPCCRFFSFLSEPREEPLSFYVVLVVVFLSFLASPASNIRVNYPPSFSRYFYPIYKSFYAIV